MVVVVVSETQPEGTVSQDRHRCEGCADMRGGTLGSRFCRSRQSCVRHDRRS